MKKYIFILLTLVFCFTSCGAGGDEIFVRSRSGKDETSYPIWIGVSVTSEAVDINEDVNIDIGWDVTEEALKHGKIGIVADGFEIYVGDVLVGTDRYSFEYEDIAETACYCRLWEGTEYETSHHKKITLRLYDGSRSKKAIVFDFVAWETEGLANLASAYLYYEIDSDNIKFSEKGDPRK